MGSIAVALLSSYPFEESKEFVSSGKCLSEVSGFGGLILRFSLLNPLILLVSVSIMLANYESFALVLPLFSFACDLNNDGGGDVFPCTLLSGGQ